MKNKSASAWSAARSEEHFGFKRWGSGHYSVDADGFVNVHPEADARSIRVLDVIDEALGMGLKAPMVVRFQDLLRHRVIQLNETFRQAIKQEGYKGEYRGVFPIKVNQLREVVDEIIAAGREYSYGLEAGSKPELMIALAMHEGGQRLIICNGYKDQDYIHLALLGRKLGKKIVLVVEQLSELDEIIRLSLETGVKPMIGFRAKLQTRGEGKWATSTGDDAKFGLNTAEILFAVEKLKAARLTSALRLVHFHIGSQVPNILTIKSAVIEAARYYCQLAKMGFPMGYLDVGGGLGIDYDGSRTNFESSMNYSMEEYARDVVFNIREICNSSGVPVPDIVSESGRAVVAPHSLLVVEVFERINKRESLGQKHQPKQKHKVVTDLEVMLRNKTRLGRLERYHDALQKKNEALSLFNLGYLDLENRAAAESLFWQICEQIEKENQKAGYLPEELHDLKKVLADQYVCNFSVFQSLLDHWGLDQLFPIAPLHRLKEKPTVNAVLVDITCDSDGKIDQFIDLQDVKHFITLHPLNSKPYYLGIYLTGAYQDIMGDLHNLFGRVNEAHVFLEADEPNGFYIEEALSGSKIADVIEGVQYQQEDLCRRMKAQIDAATKKDMVKPREGVRMLEEFERQMQSKTYLNIEPKNGRKKKRKADMPYLRHWTRLIVAIGLLGLAVAALAQPAAPKSAIAYGDNLAAGNTAEINGIKLYYESYGSGRPLVVLHGNGGSIEDLGRQIAFFSPDYRVIAVDSRGHGKSGLGTGRLTFEQQAEDINALLDKLQLKSVLLFGWSDGGVIGLLLAIHHPDTVARLAIMGANVTPDGAHPWAREWASATNREISQMIARGDKSQPWPLLQQQMDLLIKQPNIPFAQLEKIAVPVLVMAADRDIIRPEHTQEIFDHLKQAQLAIFPGATHLIPSEAPEVFNQTLKRFFAQPFTRPESKDILK